MSPSLSKWPELETRAEWRDVKHFSLSSCGVFCISPVCDSSNSREYKERLDIAESFLEMKKKETQGNLSYVYQVDVQYPFGNVPKAT